jgi:periplasmic divalent cation tolerance protein
LLRRQSQENQATRPGFFVFAPGNGVMSRGRGGTGRSGARGQGDTITAAKFVRPGASATMNVTLLLTTVPDTTTAEKLGSDVLTAGLAACVTQLGAVRSSFHWQGKLESADEIQLLFKTSVARAFELEQFIQAHHPYDIPEILTWQVTASAAYGQWVHAETQRSIHV